MEWLRWHHGTVGDPKLRMVAAEAGQPVAVVIAVWASLLECASLAADRGSISDFSPKLCAFTIGAEPSAVVATMTAMRDAEMLLDDRIRAWDKRQPAREDEGATDRKRRQRDRERDAERVTHGHAPSRTVQHQSRQIDRVDRTESDSSVDVALQHDGSLNKTRAKPAPASGEAEDFIRFYDLYPRHEGRGQARRAWRAATAKAKPPDIMAGLARAIARWRSAGTDPKFIPLPATWLNGERWGDETPQPTSSKGPTSGYASIVS